MLDFKVNIFYQKGIFRNNEWDSSNVHEIISFLTIFLISLKISA